MRSQARSLSARAAVLTAVAIGMGALCSASARANQSVSAAEEAAQLLAQGRCRDGVERLNAGLSERDPQAYFVAGFMYARGLCVAVDVTRALPLLEVAAKAGWMEAARELALIHGSGRGVAQSYAESGRWAVAMLDIMDLRLGIKPRTRDVGANGSLDVQSAQAYGYLVTVHELAGDGVRSLMDDRRNLPAIPMLLKVEVTLNLPGPRLDIELGSAERQRDASGSRPLGQTGATRLIGEVRAVYDAAMKRLPPPPVPGVGVRLMQPYNVRIL